MTLMHPDFYLLRHIVGTRIKSENQVEVIAQDAKRESLDHFHHISLGNLMHIPPPPTFHKHCIFTAPKKSLKWQWYVLLKV